MTRDEHIVWAKARALEYLPDNPIQAFSSMVVDLTKHEETRDMMSRPGAFLPFARAARGQALSADVVRAWLEGLS